MTKDNQHDHDEHNTLFHFLGYCERAFSLIRQNYVARRTKRYTREILTNQFPEMLEHPDDDYPMFGPDGIADLVSDRTLAEAINALDDKSKCVLYYCVLLDYPTKRTAKLMGYSEQHIRRLKKGALATLRSALRRSSG